MACRGQSCQILPAESAVHLPCRRGKPVSSGHAGTVLLNSCFEHLKARDCASLSNQYCMAIPAPALGMSRDLSGKLLVGAAVPANEGQPDWPRASALAEADLDTDQVVTCPLRSLLAAPIAVLVL